MQGDGNQNQDWQPLESNPQVINNFIEKLGLDISLFNFQEILSKQQWALEMILSPVLGVVLCYEQTPIQSEFHKTQAQMLKPEQVPKQIFYMKQYAQNACGTIALFHIILNSLKDYPFIVKQDSYLMKFYQNSKDADSKKKGQLFKENKQVMSQHKQAVNEGQSQIPCSVNSHFIGFISNNGRLWELDGCKKCPVDHGACEPNELLKKSIGVIEQFMMRDPDNINFSMIALAKTPEL